MKNLTLIFILFVMVSPLIFQDYNSGTQNYPIYLAFLLFLMLLIMYFLLNPRFNKPKIKSIVDLIPLSILFIWLYGVINGILSGNNPNFIIRNFAGMVMYVLYYIMIWQNISRKKLFMVVLFSGFIYTIIALINMSDYLKIHSNIISIYGFNRIYYNVGAIVIFPLMLVSMGAIFYKKKNIFIDYNPSILFKIILSKIIASSLFVLTFISSVLLPFSKGNILAFNFFILFLFMIYIFSRTPIFTKGLTLFIISLCSMIIIYNPLINDFLFNLFDLDSSGNYERYEQIVFLQKNLTFMGGGLGATINGYTRSPGTDYGFETTYLNLIHKFGIFSIILYIGYIISMYIPLRRIIKKQELIISSASLGMMGFVFPAIGNPMLYAPVAVILHCSALYILRTTNPNIDNTIYHV